MSARPFPVPGRPAVPDRAAIRRRRRLGAAALAVVAALTLAACGSRPSEQAASSTEPIVIGISLPLTGDFSQPGGEAKRGYEIWQKQVNAKGGLLGRQVQLKIVDDASSQDTVVSDYTKLITQDKVDLVLGTFSSLLNYPASAVAEKNQMVFVEPAGGAPNMFTRGFKYLFFAQQATAPHQADVFVNYIKSLPADQRPKTAAYPTQDDPFAAPVIESMEKQLTELGVKTVYSQTYPADTTNFQSIASQLSAKKPDLIAQGAVFEDGVGLVRSLKQLDYSPKMLFQTSAPSNAGQYSSAIGEANTEGVFYTVSWSQDAKTPQNAGVRRRLPGRVQGRRPGRGRRRRLRHGAGAADGDDQGRLDRPGQDPRLAARQRGADDPRPAELDGDRRAARPVPARAVAVQQGPGGRAGEVATTQTVVNPKPDWK